MIPFHFYVTYDAANCEPGTPLVTVGRCVMTQEEADLLPESFVLLDSEDPNPNLKSS